MKFRPSSLPMLAQCPRFESAPDTGERDKTGGTLRHCALANALTGDRTALESLPDDEAERVEWALEYVQTHAPTSDHPMRIEQRLSLMDESFNELTGGTPDVTCGRELFDLKWRERDYVAQMAAYAVAMIQENGWTSVRVHVLFAERKFAQVFELTETAAMDLITQIIARSESADAEPKACDYCGWCAKCLTCPAKTSNVKPLVDAREEFSAEQREVFAKWLAEGAHASKLSEPGLMGTALKISRQIGDWCEAVEHHAKEMAVKQGIVPTGFKLQSRQGNRFIPSVTNAFARVGLPQEEFLKACEVKFSNLVEHFADVNGMKKAQAERTVEEKLGDAVQRKSPSLSLVMEKGAK